VGIALGVRDIIETLAAHDYETRELRVAGGHLHNPLLMELYANATGAMLLEPKTIDATLLGVAMVGAVAAGRYPGLGAAAKAMAPGLRSHHPDPKRQAQLEIDYRIFKQMLAHRRQIEELRTAIAE
jgi:ribulose kinase